MVLAFLLAPSLGVLGNWNFRRLPGRAVGADHRLWPSDHLGCLVLLAKAAQKRRGINVDYAFKESRPNKSFYSNLKTLKVSQTFRVLSKLEMSWRSLKKLLKKIDDWKNKKVNIKTLSGGLTNHKFFGEARNDCTHETEHDHV